MLSRIDSPADLKGLPLPDLHALAEEIRSFVIDGVCHSGGHLGPSLGVVELTIALEYVYDFTRDRLVWDVGHQCYPHKILTGRRDRFSTLRQFGGVSGFPKREESLYDHFGTGHAGTSVSAALGMAVARDASGDDYSVLAVLGDGAASAGMIFEALNHAGDVGTGLTVVLNDNAWSISKSVGGMAEYLNRLITTPAYNKLRSELWRITGLLPSDSKTRARKMAHLFQESVKNLLVPGTMFEELGFRYIGPVNGHSLATLIRTFKYVRSLPGPVLVHVVTQKGKGYAPAESDGQKLHGVGPFDREKGPPPDSGGMTFTKVFGATLVELARHDSRIVAITAAMPSGTGLDLFGQEYPSRFFDVGIAEQHAVTLAAGMATGGLRPVVAIYSTFMQRAYDQVVHDVCLQNLPVVLAMDRGGLVGEDGPTHHGVFDLSYLRPIPNLVIVAPSDEAELQRALVFALEHDGPVALRYPRGKGPGIALAKHPRPLELGQARMLRRGGDVAFIGVGPIVYDTLEAAGILSDRGIQACVLDCRFVKPLDEAAVISAAAGVKLIVTVEDNALSGGFGGAIAELFMNRPGHAPIVRIGVPDSFVPHGALPILRERLGMIPQRMASTVEDALAAR
ncbi:1-deoxy-D-xylulose-5-phosphate synthase [Candidatus Fermentibacteria bacterium]|nr:1-deoxy-D-xylulose-5-phosphate synthase [Candidatus Fermentibacteria bacterium]